MIRPILTLIAATAVAAGAVSVHASGSAGPHPAGMERPVHLLGSALATHSAVGSPRFNLSSALPAIHTGPIEARRDAAAPAQQTPVGAALALPPSAFTPATINQQFTGLLDAVHADQDFFASFHTATYVSMGFQGGFYARADETNGVIQRYQGGIFSDTTHAVTAMNDALAKMTPVAIQAPTDCSSIGNSPCKILGAVDQSNNLISYGVAEYNQCLIETAGFIPPAIASASDTTALKAALTLQVQILGAGLVMAHTACAAGTSGTPVATPGTGATPVLTPAPGVTPVPTQVTQTVFKVDGIIAAKDQQGTKPIKKIKAKKKFFLVMGWTLTSAPAGSVPAYDIKVTTKGKTVYHEAFNGTLSSYDPGSYVVASQAVTAPAAGTFKLKASVTLNGLVQSASGKVKITK